MPLHIFLCDEVHLYFILRRVVISGVNIEKVLKRKFDNPLVIQDEIRQPSSHSPIQPVKHESDPNPSSYPLTQFV
jgi:hypothetical protein